MSWLLVLGCLALAAEPAADPVVAKVGGVEIHASEWAAEAAKKGPADGKALTAAERRAVLDELVADRLLYLEAKKSETALAAPEVRDALVRALLRDEVYAGVAAPTAAEVRAYYDAHAAEFTRPAGARVSRILLRTGPKRDAAAAKAEAQALRASLEKDPKSFAATAKAKSQDATAAQGGDMGYVTEVETVLPKALHDAIFSTDAGKLSAVVMTDEGANLLYVANRTAAQARPFETVRDDLRQRLLAERQAAALEARVAAARKGVDVRVDQAALDAVKAPAAKAPAKAPVKALPATEPAKAAPAKKTTGK